MSTILRQYKIFIWLCVGILTAFTVRTWLAASDQVPRFFDLFDSLTVAGSILICLRGFRSLRRGDWMAALILAGLVGVGMLFATLFTPYPFFDIVRDNAGQAVVRGFFTFAAALSGLVIMRCGGPVMFHAAHGEWHKTGQGILLGLVVGLPLAIVNVIALQLTGGQTIAWQDPLVALLDALQPGIVEEIIYRFALWGLLWLALRNSLPERSAAFAGGLATLVHTFSHFDVLLVQAPLTALGMGLAMTLLWGMPLFFLARRRGLESAVAFHWVQDAARFAAGL